MKLQWLINGILKKDDYDIMIWFRWYSQKDVECIDCIKTKAMISKEKPDCEKCGLPVAILMKKYFPQEKKEKLVNETKD